VSAAAELEIRLRRATFNQALAKGDLAAIGGLLAPDVVLVAGTDSALLTGRKAQLLAWKREFAAPARLVYTRTPDLIRVSDVEPIALEQGRWEGVAAQGGDPTASGLYSAKWRCIGADWMIDAEIYVTFA